MAWTPGTLGIIGSGMIGSALARLAVAAGLDVVVAAVPLEAYDRLPSEALARPVTPTTALCPSSATTWRPRPR